MGIDILGADILGIDIQALPHFAIGNQCNDGLYMYIL